MKKRYLYSILFGIPGLILSVMISLVIFGVTAGVLWIYIFGDSPWPASTEILLPILFALTFLIAWIIIITIGFITGKKLESDPVLKGNTSWFQAD